MKVDMSYTTCQNLSDLQDRRKGSLPGSGTSTRISSSESRNSRNFLPHLSKSKGCSSAESSFDEVDSKRDHYRQRQNQSRRSYDSSAGNENDDGTAKFPQVSGRHHKSQSVTSLFSNRSRGTPPRAEMCKSPSCPSLWSECEEPGFVEDGDLSASIHPVHTRRSTGGSFMLPDLYDAGRKPETTRSVSYNENIKSSKIGNGIQKLSLRRQREEEDRRDRFRQAHRQQQLDRQKTQPVALLLPIRDPSRANRAKQPNSQSMQNQRRSGSSIHSYNSTYSVKSDSGISTSLRQSDASEAASYRAEESEWSGWEEGEHDPEEDDDDDEEYQDADDAGYEDDEYEDAENEPYYSAQGSYEDEGQYKHVDQEEQGSEEGDNASYDDKHAHTVPTTGYRAPRHRRYKVAQSQNAQDYQPKIEMDPQEKCQEWLHGRKKKAQKDKST